MKEIVTVHSRSSLPASGSLRLVANNTDVARIYYHYLHAMSAFYLTNLWVDLRYRRRGLATRILAETLVVIKQQHAGKKITLNVKTTNNAAIQLYNKFGFIENKDRQHKKVTQFNIDV